MWANSYLYILQAFLCMLITRLADDYWLSSKMAAQGVEQYHPLGHIYLVRFNEQIIGEVTYNHLYILTMTNSYLPSCFQIPPLFIQQISVNQHDLQSKAKFWPIDETWQKFSIKGWILSYISYLYIYICLNAKEIY